MKGNKVFMGDTGTLTLGLILSFKWKSLFVTKNEEAAPRMVGKLASVSSTEGADC